MVGADGAVPFSDVGVAGLKGRDSGVGKRANNRGAKVHHRWKTGVSAPKGEHVASRWAPWIDGFKRSSSAFSGLCAWLPSFAWEAAGG